MAASCVQLNTLLARQTPVFSDEFLKDFKNDMGSSPYLGRHKTATWDDGAETRQFDKIHVGMPDLTSAWNVRRGADCNQSKPTNTFIAHGSTRDQHDMENRNLSSQLFDLDQLRTVPKLKEQMAEIYKGQRQVPLMFSNDFLRTRMLSFNDTLQICGAACGSLAITGGEQLTPTPGATAIDRNATVINLGSAANLPTSDLTLTYLEYLAQMVGLNGYDSESGLPAGMRSLVTHSRTFQRLVGLNPEIKSFVKLADFKDVSPLYMPGKGINANPFGRFAPTFDEMQLRYQDDGTNTGRLERVLSHYNVAATTGIKKIQNPAWLNARYGISTILHPKSTTLFTPKPSKVHEMVPTINSSMWGKWEYIGGSDTKVFIYTQPDGTSCTIDNRNGWLFYWNAYLELGLKYEQRDLNQVILHLIDGAGKASIVDNPIAGAAPQYVIQTTSDAPGYCQA
jgi:hypothetical protein